MAFVLGIFVGRRRSVDWVERAALAEIEAEDRTENSSIDFDVRIDTVVQSFESLGFELEIDEDGLSPKEKPAPVILVFQRKSKTIGIMTLNICLFIALMPMSLCYVMGLGCIDRQAKRIEFMVEE
ncbi:MAG: hypothetical protein HOB79_21095 [Rhodospirillaceae bacterium]|jgi:hypothetical protein|nr:hypothetical protein [Rhodospirillaceae bacterium]MBT7486202.1 hypothetical protein [Rhodospirillales bacterium]MBT4703576.1 hypothetical protein [Rhodospirillaceae bacterium]MBT5036324.1 hypothetical protein [Rhodospirillaceae bacterium]MBT6218247.1 hypothetical protein [Rhodospirillaceae bacterium]